MATRKKTEIDESPFTDVPVDPVETPTINDNGQNQEEKIVEEPAPVKRGRGRPKGSGAKTDTPQKSKSRQAQDTTELAKQIVGIHAIAAMATGIGELVIDETEGRMLANGINAVCQEYNLSLGGKTGAMIQLIGAMGVVYLPRLVVIKKRTDAERAKSNTEVSDADFSPIMSGAPNAAAFN